MTKASVFLINGPSTSGKTTIGNELVKRGYEVINTDDAFGYYANIKTEQPVEFPGYEVSEDWYEVNGWLWDKKKVEAVFGAASGVLFFCGGALNESAYYPRFSKVFRLHVNPDALEARLAERGEDPHTTNPLFKQRMLDMIERAEEDAKSLNQVLIDTSDRDLETTVDEILEHIQ